MGDKIEDIIIIRVRCLCGLAIEFALTLLKRARAIRNSNVKSNVLSVFFICILLLNFQVDYLIYI